MTVVIIEGAGVLGRATYEPVPGKPGLWQEIHGPTRIKHGDPISSDELLERVRKVILGADA